MSTTYASTLQFTAHTLTLDTPLGPLTSEFEVCVQADTDQACQDFIDSVWTEHQDAIQNPVAWIDSGKTEQVLHGRGQWGRPARATIKAESIGMALSALKALSAARTRVC